MQHFGWLETYIYARYPQHELVFRNLGYGGDEVNGYRELYSRMRSMDFGSQDQWLAGEAPIPQPQKLNKDAPVSKNRFGLHQHAGRRRLCLLRIQRVVRRTRRGWPSSRRISTASSSTRWRSATTANRRRGSSSFRRSPTRTSRDPNLPDGDREQPALGTLHATRWPMSPRPMASFSSTFSLLRDSSSETSRPESTINGIHLTEQGDRDRRRALPTRGCFGERAGI